MNIPPEVDARLQEQAINEADSYCKIELISRSSVAWYAYRDATLKHKRLLWLAEQKNNRPDVGEVIDIVGYEAWSVRDAVEHGSAPTSALMTMVVKIGRRLLESGLCKHSKP